MKLVSWNVNGIRSLWKDVRLTLDELGADIACFQETKITKDMMMEELAIIPEYRSYFSYCRTRAGYSGVVTYCKRAIQPVDATDSLIGALSSGEGELTFSLSPDVLKALDCEGRTVITQHQLSEPVEGKSLLSVINVYCPCVTGEKDGRETFRLQFLQTLEERVVQLQKVSHVLVVGDLNISHRPIDHCDPGDETEFVEQPHRQWLNRMLDTEAGLLTDTYRVLHPDKKFVFSCWNTKIGARQTNYGSRIDYILLDQRIKHCVTSADVLSKYLGSDHCPVSVVLSLDMQPSSQPPLMCSSHRYKAKQQKLTMFMKKSDDIKKDPFDSLPTNCSNRIKKKRKPSNVPSSSSLNSFIKKAKDNECESTVSSESTNSSQDKVSQPDSSQTDSSQPDSSQPDSSQPDSSQPDSSQPDSQPILVPSGENVDLSGRQRDTTLKAWPKLFHKTRKQAPKCDGHKERCVLKTVSKTGSNKGRQFYSCSRPVGLPGDRQARCSYFAWADAS
ncbi:DNA-(apurinic or apyrimidinic site) endonuclease 2-like [Watersipora subatra]|uniref:DNA-(apurinic or apyrimidinic site) endonuclease 2-like n=1 Tax=Watersipora subatra TaxID=2589382 RepID=UPI00355C1AB7